MNNKLHTHVFPPLQAGRGQTWLNLTLLAGLLPVLTGCTETLMTKTTPAVTTSPRVAAPQPVTTPPPAVGDVAPAKPKTAATRSSEREPLPWPPKPGKEPKPAQEAASPHKLYEWHDQERRVTRIVINTDEQRAHFYDGEQEVGWSTVATGTKTHPTPSGEFEVLEKMADKASNLYGRIYNRAGKVVNSDAMLGRDPIPPGGRFVGAKMPNFLRVTYDGVGLHAGLIPRPGSPASHGCVRMPEQVASTLYDRVAVGTKVTVVGSGPSHGNYAVRIKEQRRAQEEARRIAAVKAEKAAAARAQKLAAARAAKARAARLAQAARTAAATAPVVTAVDDATVTTPVTSPVNTPAATTVVTAMPPATPSVPVSPPPAVTTAVTLPPPLPVVTTPPPVAAPVTPPAPAVAPAVAATPLPPPLPAPAPAAQPVPTPAVEAPTPLPPLPTPAPSAAPQSQPTGMLVPPSHPATSAAIRAAQQRAI